MYRITDTLRVGAPWTTCCYLKAPSACACRAVWKHLTEAHWQGFFALHLPNDGAQTGIYSETHPALGDILQGLYTAIHSWDTLPCFEAPSMHTSWPHVMGGEDRPRQQACHSKCQLPDRASTASAERPHSVPLPSSVKNTHPARSIAQGQHASPAWQSCPARVLQRRLPSRPLAASGGPGSTCGPTGRRRAQ